MSLHLLTIAFLCPTAKHIHLASQGEPYILKKGMLFEGVPPSHLLRCLDVEFAQSALWSNTSREKQPPKRHISSNHHECCWGIFQKKHTKNTSNSSLHFPWGLGGEKKNKHIVFQGQVNQVRTNQVKKHLSKTPLWWTLRGEAGCSVIWPNYYTPWKIFTAGTYKSPPMKRMEHDLNQTSRELCEQAVHLQGGMSPT